jgi:hypothetical protein
MPLFFLLQLCIRIEMALGDNGNKVANPEGTINDKAR